MKKIEDYSVEELEELIEKKRKEENKKPEPLDNVDFQPLFNLVKEVISDLAEGKHNDDDEHYIYEAALEAVYGCGIWDWYNKQS